jgi:predicted DNA binding CopG/RHH family protein
MRMPQALPDALKDRAKRKGVPYQRFIRRALEQALAGPGSGGVTAASGD